MRIDYALLAKEPTVFFRRAYRCRERIAAKEQRLAYWRSLAERITFDVSAASTAKTQATNKTESYVVRIVDIQLEIWQGIGELVKAEHEVEYIINKFFPENTAMKELLMLRYLNCMRWEDIAEHMGYTLRWVMTLHTRALDEIRKESALIP